MDRCGGDRTEIRSFDLADPELSQRRYVVLEGNTTTSFEDEPCDHQKEGWCPRVVESDRDVTCSEHFGGTGKQIRGFKKIQKKRVPFLDHDLDDDDHFHKHQARNLVQLVIRYVTVQTSYRTTMT